MKQYNKQAADLIYREKNQHRPENEIDLHGLFVQEATERVDEAIKLCKRQGYENLTIIVGKGLHSPGQIAKLKPAIIEMVQKYEVNCEPNRPNPGCLYITFGQGTGDLSWIDKFADKLQQHNTCTIIIVYCIPIPFINQPSDSFISITSLTNSLGDYYESITDQVLISFTKEITSIAASIYLTNYDQDQEKEAEQFISSLEDHLHLMKTHLIASVRPLIDANLPWTLSINDDDDDDSNKKKKDGTFPIWTQSMTKKVLLLNQRLSSQLGIIINVDESSYMMIYQSLPKKQQQLEMKAYNELDDLMDDVDWMEDKLNDNYDMYSNEIYNNNNNQYIIKNGKSNKIMIDDYSLNIPHEQLMNWLSHWLLDIEIILLNEFNNRIEDLIQTIMEDVLYD
ncbi:unnamed protein product [Cunninghamella blakesleeana]